MMPISPKELPKAMRTHYIQMGNEHEDITFGPNPGDVFFGRRAVLENIAETIKESMKQSYNPIEIYISKTSDGTYGYQIKTPKPVATT